MDFHAFMYVTIGRRHELERGMAGKDPVLYQRMLDEIAEYARTCDATGWSGIGVPEHHLQVEGFELGQDPGLMAMFLGQHGPRLRINQFGYVLPTHNPLRVAEHAATLARDFAKHRKRLSFIRAADVTPAVRALAWGDRSLFGVGRVTKVADWRLKAQLPARGDEAIFEPGATWTLFAGGDILLDRGVYETLRVKGRGEDFPFDGGTAEITSRCKDCSPLGWDLPRTRRTGNTGVVRELITGADIAAAL